MPRLTVFLGGGGAGKTTLSAARALALARQGERVGLLSIDPAQRLQSALGTTGLADEPVRIEIAGARGELRAAMLRPAESLRRWAAESVADEAARARLLANRYFLGLADRIAASTDAIAAGRLAEWVERDPAVDELVVDTAPGLPAIEFFARPEKLMRFFDARLVRSLRRVALLGGLPARGVARHLAIIAGESTLLGFGEFIDLVDVAFARMRERLERARDWFRDPSTSLVVVCGVDDRAAGVARAMVRALGELGLSPRFAVLNRALPPALVDRAAALAGGPGSAGAFARYAQRHLRLQTRVRAELDDAFARVIELPETSGLSKLEALAALGEALTSAAREIA